MDFKRMTWQISERLRLFSVFEFVVWFIACTLTDDQSMMAVRERFYEV